LLGQGVEDCLGDSRSLGVENCSDGGDFPGLEAEDFSALGDLLWPGVVDCSKDLPGLGVEDCSVLGDSPVVQIRFVLAQEHWRVEHFGQRGQRSAHLLPYSASSEVVC